MNRVVVTGMAGISPIGDTWAQVGAALRSGVSGIDYVADWDCYEGLHTRLGGQIRDWQAPPHFTRKRTRTMGRVSAMSVQASEQALVQAGLTGDAAVADGSMGVAYGSRTGSTDAMAEFAQMLIRKATDGVNATTYIRMMSHTTAVNIAVFFGLKGRVIPTSSACTSGSQGIGYAYEAIRTGKQALMLAGGGEELCVTEAAVFDTLYATSTRNHEPKATPRPYDRDRDGLVIGEGAATLVLEDLEHARARGAEPLAEIVGFATNCDGTHVTQPNAETMEVAMKLALAEAELSPDAIGYISGHGTATVRGDIAETQATHRVFGAKTPISSLKGHTGHTLGACGAIEAWTAVGMLNQDWYAPTLNLDNLDSACGDLDYINGAGRAMSAEYVMSNNFAFGGINTSLIFRRCG